MATFFNNKKVEVLERGATFSQVKRVGEEDHKAFSAPNVQLEEREDKVRVRKIAQFNPAAKYKVGHNMRPYLAQAIYERRPNLLGVFTERVKTAEALRLDEARDWLIDHPAFLTMVDTFLQSRGTDEPIAIQFFVELYRWDENTANAVLAAQHPDVLEARREQETAWQEEFAAEQRQ